MLHVAHIDVDPADIVHGTAGLFDRGLDVVADLPRLRLDIADAGDAAVGAPRGHAGDEDEAAARGHHGGVGKMPARLAKLWRDDLGLRHGFSRCVANLWASRTAPCVPHKTTRMRRG